MNALPLPIRLARYGLFAMAGVTLAFGLVLAYRLIGAPFTFTSALVAGLMLGAAIVYALLAVGIGRGSRWAYRLSVAWLSANIVLTITDQFGPADLINLIAVTAMLGLLLAGRRGYFASAGGAVVRPD